MRAGGVRTTRTASRQPVTYRLSSRIILTMQPNRWSIPNLLSLLRLILVPTLWVFALLDLPKVVGFGLVVAAVTDVLDGQLARRLGQTSSFGSKLDSIA